MPSRPLVDGIAAGYGVCFWGFRRNMLQKARNEEITIGLKSTTVVNKTINYQIIICYFKYS